MVSLFFGPGRQTLGTVVRGFLDDKLPSKYFSVIVDSLMPPNPEWIMISTSTEVMNSSFASIADHDLISENGTPKLQGISFVFNYERSSGFAESALITPLILIFIG